MTIFMTYATLSTVYVVFGLEQRGKRLPLAQRLVLKCLPVVFLSICTAWRVFGASTLAIPNTKELLVSLVLSAIGDGLLLFKQRKDLFLCGIATFGTAQLCNIILLGGAKMEGVWQGVFSVLLSSFLYFFVLYPGLKPFLVVPAAIYCFLMTILLWRGLVLVTVPTSDWSVSSLMGGFGCLSYYVSDLTLGIQLSSQKFPLGDQVVIITYYLAQVFLFSFVFY